MSERRIEYVPLDELLPADRNPKLHRLDVLAESMGRFGYVEPTVIDERTGKLVAGHGRADTLRQKREAGEEPPEGVRVDEEGRWTVPVLRGWSSADDREAEAYLLASNRTTEIGGWDDRELVGLLTGLGADGLDGVGWAEADVDLLLAALSDVGPTDPAAEWTQMPPFESRDMNAAVTIHIHFPTEEDCDRFFSDVLQLPRSVLGLGGPATKSMWWPQHDGFRGNDSTKVAVAEPADG